MEVNIIKRIERILSKRGPSLRHLLDIILTASEFGMSYETSEEIGRSISLYETKEKKRSCALNLQNKILKDTIKMYKDAAFKDPLTDLPNRRYFDIYLNYSFKQCNLDIRALSNLWITSIISRC